MAAPRLLRPAFAVAFAISTPPVRSDGKANNETQMRFAEPEGRDSREFAFPFLILPIHHSPAYNFQNKKERSPSRSPLHQYPHDKQPLHRPEQRCRGLPKRRHDTGGSRGSRDRRVVVVDSTALCTVADLVSPGLCVCVPVTGATRPPPIHLA